MLLIIDKAPLDKDLKRDLTNSLNSEWHRRLSPSEVLSHIISSSVSQIHRLISQFSSTIIRLYASLITTSTYVFIDSLDQALSYAFPCEIAVWTASQHGLMKAVWELARFNRHVKIFCSIRQEAFSSYTGDDKVEIYAASLKLEYTRNDLQQIFAKSLSAFEIKNQDSEVEAIESQNRIGQIFDNIYPVILPIPRWLMIVGQALSFSKEFWFDSSNTQFKPTLFLTTGYLGEAYLNNELSIFFSTSNPRGITDLIFPLLKSNCLTPAIVTAISEKFRQANKVDFVNSPFDFLYNIGLLGYVDVLASPAIQKFSKPWDFRLNYMGLLPRINSGYYLIHSCLTEVVLRVNRDYLPLQDTIGDGVAWTKHHQSNVDKNRIKIFLSYSHKDRALVERVAEIVKTHFTEGCVDCDIWLDQWKMSAGQWVQEEIEKGLESSDVLLFFISKNSLGSSYVNAEWRTMFNRKLENNKNSVLPIIIDDSSISQVPLFLRNLLIYTLSSAENQVSDIEKICRSITSLTNIASNNKIHPTSFVGG
jgi:hypothetical protein